MKRDGFLITEIVIFICTIAIIAIILFPLKIIDLNQAKRIASWKSFYPELVYSFTLMQAQEQQLLNYLDQNEEADKDIFFKEFKKYLPVDETKNISNNYFSYHHVFLNGKIVKKLSKYKANKFICLKNNMIIGFVKTQNKIEEIGIEKPIGLLFIDIDGKTRSNNIGKDVFIVAVYPSKLVPMGANSTLQEMKKDCSSVGSGLKCAAYYLVGSSF